MGMFKGLMTYIQQPVHVLTTNLFNNRKLIHTGFLYEKKFHENDFERFTIYSVVDSRLMHDDIYFFLFILYIFAIHAKYSNI